MARNGKSRVELVPRDALEISPGTFALGVAFVLEQADQNAKKLPCAPADLSGGESGTLSVLCSRRVALYIRRKGAALLRLSHEDTTRGLPRPYVVGSFSSGDFATSVSTAGLRGAGSGLYGASHAPTPQPLGVRDTAVLMEHHILPFLLDFCGRKR